MGDITKLTLQMVRAQMNDLLNKEKNELVKILSSNNRDDSCLKMIENCFLINRTTVSNMTDLQWTDQQALCIKQLLCSILKIMLFFDRITISNCIFDEISKSISFESTADSNALFALKFMVGMDEAWEIVKSVNDCCLVVVEAPPVTHGQLVNICSAIDTDNYGDDFEMNEDDDCMSSCCSVNPLEEYLNYIQNGTILAGQQLFCVTTQINRGLPVESDKQCFFPACNGVVYKPHCSLCYNMNGNALQYKAFYCDSHRTHTEEHLNHILSRGWRSVLTRSTVIRRALRVKDNHTSICDAAEELYAISPMTFLGVKTKPLTEEDVCRIGEVISRRIEDKRAPPLDTTSYTSSPLPRNSAVDTDSWLPSFGYSSSANRVSSFIAREVTTTGSSPYDYHLQESASSSSFTKAALESVSSSNGQAVSTGLSPFDYIPSADTLAEFANTRGINASRYGYHEIDESNNE
jgi:hypothetical protein